MVKNKKLGRILSALVSLILAATVLVSVGAVSSPESGSEMSKRGTIASSSEQKGAEEYFNNLFNGEKLPFSFKIGDVKYNSFNSDFTEVKKGKNGIYALHNSGIAVSVTFEHDFEYAEMEWQVTFENTTDSNTPVISDVNAIDLVYSGKNPSLNYSMGDVVDDPYIYAAFDAPLSAGMTMAFDPECGKSTGHQKPYYRLTTEDGGLILALGWQGRWKMNFSSERGENGCDVSVKGGQYELDTYLKAGEKIMTPSVVLLRFEGNDKFHQINMWRRWFYDCAAVRNDEGELFGSQITYGPSMSITPDQNEDNMIRQLRNYYKNYTNTIYWIDAGWYPIYGDDSLPITNSYWRYTGTWRIDEKRFPSKFADLKAEFKDGVQLLLWFEPERVFVGTELYQEKDFLLMGNSTEKYAVLLNMGNPDAVSYAAEKVVGIMDEVGVDIYRQDFNIDPYTFWYNGDIAEGDNRMGITENLYIQGLMDYYMTILEHTDNPIDMCASGGMRNDISVMKFSINLTISDTDALKYTIHQNIRLCYNEWFSMFYGPGNSNNNYAAASTLSYITSAGGSDKWDLIDHLMLADYYPLTEFSADDNVWCAYEFFDPELNEGFVSVIRRPKSEEKTFNHKLYGLDPETKYRLSDIYSGRTMIKTGEELMTDGLGVFLDEGSAAVFKISPQTK